MRKNYYQIIGVSPLATLSDIKRAYRKKAKSSHPDHGGNKDEMIEINEAFSVLSDVLLRRKYDDEIKAAQQNVDASGIPQTSRQEQSPPGSESASRIEMSELESTFLGIFLVGIFLQCLAISRALFIVAVLVVCSACIYFWRGKIFSRGWLSGLLRCIFTDIKIIFTDIIRGLFLLICGLVIFAFIAHKEIYEYYKLSATPQNLGAVDTKAAAAKKFERLKKSAELGAAAAAKKLEQLKKSAEQGDASAQFNLGAMYAFGEGAPKDSVKAIEWYRKAAEQGDAMAQSSLGVMYAIGEGVPKDSVKAVEWFRKSAEQGYAKAQTSLGLRYASGDGVPKDEIKAVEWFRKAAEQGDAGAQCNLGWVYDFGEGVPKDEIEALAWYSIAAAVGSEKAVKYREISEARLGRAGTLTAQRRSREILKEIEAAKAARASTKGNQ